MAITTSFLDDKQKGIREAWQQGAVVFTWTLKEVETMHAESPKTVPEFGRFASSIPMPSFSHTGQL
jgi:hypothetical protein